MKLVTFCSATRERKRGRQREKGRQRGKGRKLFRAKNEGRAGKNCKLPTSKIQQNCQAGQMRESSKWTFIFLIDIATVTVVGKDKMMMEVEFLQSFESSECVISKKMMWNHTKRVSRHDE